MGEADFKISRNRPARAFLSYDKLNDEIAAYKLSLFNLEICQRQFKPIYQTPTRSFTRPIANLLIGMMKVN